MNAVRTIAVVKLIVWALLAYSMFTSATHITDTAHSLGLEGFAAYTLWVLIDIPAIVGKLLGGKAFAKSTQRLGFKLMVFSGLLSLACNIYAGDNLGQRGHGVLVVAMFIILENVATKIKPAPAVKAAQTRARKAASGEASPAVSKRSAAAKRGHATRIAKAKAATVTA